MRSLFCLYPPCSTAMLRCAKVQNPSWLSKVTGQIGRERARSHCHTLHIWSTRVPWVQCFWDMSLQPIPHGQAQVHCTQVQWMSVHSRHGWAFQQTLMCARCPKVPPKCQTRVLLARSFPLGKLALTRKEVGWYSWLCWAGVIFSALVLQTWSTDKEQNCKL